MFEQALDGEPAALHAIYANYKVYGAGDSEAWWGVPENILCAVGDARYAQFVRGETPSVRLAALNFNFASITMAKDYPESYRLYCSYGSDKASR